MDVRSALEAAAYGQLGEQASAAFNDMTAAHDRLSEQVVGAIQAEVRAIGSILVRTDQLAAVFHEQWRQTRQRPDGSFEPRLKRTTDAEWIRVHGTDVVDIAHTEFADLPEDWKDENRAAAIVVLRVIDQQILEAARAVQQEWLQRHPDRAGTELDADLLELSPEQQAKNVEQVIAALELLQQDGYPAGGRQPGGEPRSREERLDRLAAVFHEQWRETRLRPDGSFEPRPKRTTDAEWIRAHGTDVVDIAHTEFADLPEDWKDENRAAASVVLDVLDRRFVVAGRSIHNAWLERNPDAAGTELDVIFDRLSKEERERDLIQIRTALDILYRRQS